jgi:hypothetical protein
MNSDQFNELKKQLDELKSEFILRIDSILSHFGSSAPAAERAAAASAAAPLSGLGSIMVSQSAAAVEPAAPAVASAPVPLSARTSNQQQQRQSHALSGNKRSSSQVDRSSEPLDLSPQQLADLGVAVTTPALLYRCTQNGTQPVLNNGEINRDYLTDSHFVVRLPDLPLPTTAVMIHWQRATEPRTVPTVLNALEPMSVRVDGRDEPVSVLWTDTVDLKPENSRYRLPNGQRFKFKRTGVGPQFRRLRLYLYDSEFHVLASTLMAFEDAVTAPTPKTKKAKKAKEKTKTMIDTIDAAGSSKNESRDVVDGGSDNDCDGGCDNDDNSDQETPTPKNIDTDKKEQAANADADVDNRARPSPKLLSAPSQAQQAAMVDAVQASADETAQCFDKRASHSPVPPPVLLAEPPQETQAAMVATLAAPRDAATTHKDKAVIALNDSKDDELFTVMSQPHRPAVQAPPDEPWHNN